MKVLISADIEGVAGVFHPEQTRAGNREYEAARVWMAREANAALLGAFDGGASAVWVNDSHGGFRNIAADTIDVRGQVILGKPRTLGMMAGLEFSPDLVFMIGYHARSQSRGILSHTINSFAFSRVLLNGLEVGEAGLYGALAKERGAQVALLSGDDIFAEETSPLFPDARFVTVKTALGHISGASCTPEASCDLIRKAAHEVLTHALANKRTKVTPVVDVPARALQARTVSCELHVQSVSIADLFCQFPGLTRCSGVSLTFEGSSVEHVVRTLNCLSAMSQMLR